MNCNVMIMIIMMMTMTIIMITLTFLEFVRMHFNKMKDRFYFEFFFIFKRFSRNMVHVKTGSHLWISTSILKHKKNRVGTA